MAAFFRKSKQNSLLPKVKKFYFPVKRLTRSLKVLVRGPRSLRTFPIIQQTNIFFCTKNYMEFSSISKIFDELFPPYLAESWDNIGFLLEPTCPKPISTIFLTNDLTEDVLEEAISAKADLIFSYHPPIFFGIKSLHRSRWKDRIILKCIENRIVVYSPHTACDAVKDGVNDWLIKCFDVASCIPIIGGKMPTKQYSKQIDLEIPVHADVNYLSLIPKSELLLLGSDNSLKQYRFLGDQTATENAIDLISKDENCASVAMTPFESFSTTLHGMGRVGQLKERITLRDAIKKIKDFLELEHLRVAIGTTHDQDSLISTVAVCAGSGSTVLKDTVADIYVTGEMSHHDLLDANHKGVSVILCEHSNTERGYLQQLAVKLANRFQAVEIVVSKRDKDPVLIL